MQMKTQDDLVRQKQGFQPEEVTRKVTVPGLAQLHQRSTTEIAEVLANVLRSEQNIIRLTYTVGESIELVTRNLPG
jgi:hypothetical protein